MKPAHFEAVASTVVQGLSKGSDHVVALVAKWEKRDLIPGLSDLDFPIICDDDTIVDDWIAIDRRARRIHLEMVRTRPAWSRVNEHTPGAGMTVSEVLDPRFYNPEYAAWSLWWGRRDWFDRLKAFEDLLFFGFEQLFPLLVESIEHLDIGRSAGPAELKRQLASSETDPLATLVENVRDWTV